LFIVNPVSAGGLTLKVWNDLVLNLEAVPFGYDVQFTKKPGDGCKLAQDAVAKNYYDTIVSVGGDGSASDVVNGLMTAGVSHANLPAFTIFPSGTGSDSVRTLKIPKDVKSFVRVVEGYQPVLVDVGITEFVTDTKQAGVHYFLNACEIGIGAVVANVVNGVDSKKRGKAKYFRQVVEQTFRFERFNATYVYDGDSSAVEDSSVIAICNGMFFGGGMQISPKSKLDDGILELVATNRVSKVGLIGIVLKLYAGTHIPHPKINFHQAKGFDIKLKTPQLLEADGEVVSTITKATFKTLPQVLKVLR